MARKRRKGRTARRPDPTPPPQSWFGREIDGRYRIVSLIGEGGMGAVFVAEHLGLRKQVALKTILPSHAGNTELAERFAREAMASARIEHPNVVSAMDFGSLGNEEGAYLVMPLVRGATLHEWTGERSLAWQHAAHIALQIADAVGAAHAVGIVHRDLKPENVLIEERENRQPQVRVLDFGIAHVERAPEVTPSDSHAPTAVAIATRLTRVGAVLGTPGYMSPEQAMGEEVDARTDVYALGVMLWELLAGRRLFDSDSFVKLLALQCQDKPPLLPKEVRSRGIPLALRQLLSESLSRHREDRPDNANVVRERLSRLLGETPIPTGAPSATLLGEATGGLLRAAQSNASRSARKAWDTARSRARVVRQSTVRGIRPSTWGSRWKSLPRPQRALLVRATCAVALVAGAWWFTREPDDIQARGGKLWPGATPAAHQNTNQAATGEAHEQFTLSAAESPEDATVDPYDRRGGHRGKKGKKGKNHKP